MESQAICRHCKVRVVNRARGLCHSCYLHSDTRHLYPSTSPCHRRGVEDANRTGPIPSTPTPALPGTPDKIAVLAERAVRGEQLFHPHDNQWSE